MFRKRKSAEMLTKFVKTQKYLSVRLKTLKKAMKSKEKVSYTLSGHVFSYNHKYFLENMAISFL
jgi:hypothetical protein